MAKSEVAMDPSYIDFRLKQMAYDSLGDYDSDELFRLIAQSGRIKLFNQIPAEVKPPNPRTLDPKLLVMGAWYLSLGLRFSKPQTPEEGAAAISIFGNLLTQAAFIEGNEGTRRVSLIQKAIYLSEVDSERGDHLLRGVVAESIFAFGFLQRIRQGDNSLKLYRATVETDVDAHIDFFVEVKNGNSDNAIIPVDVKARSHRMRARPDNQSPPVVEFDIPIKDSNPPYIFPPPEEYIKHFNEVIDRLISD